MISNEAREDIRELNNRIKNYKDGNEDEERFKLFRLTRGVYGQRQQGVQMFRIKIPYGKISPNQLRTIANLSEQYTNGNLHITTRQNIQLHYIRLEDTPQIWEELEKSGVTTREACGNTVRGITGSPLAGIDPDEPFDISPYAQAVFEFFLRNPICQDMGRKIKIAFSSSEADAAFTYIHDFGFIPRIRGGEKGFKVLVGGGLGAQSMLGVVAHDFLPEDQVIPFIESGLRVFDRYGERERRHKARLKYLIEPGKGLGLDGFLKLVEEQREALSVQSFEVDSTEIIPEEPGFSHYTALPIKDVRKFEDWKRINVFEQKQNGFFGVKIRIPLGNLTSNLARGLSNLAEKYASDDMRLTVNQGLLLKFLREENLPNVYAELESLGLADPGFDSLVDITACPGTDTCNLGVTNSTAISTVLEEMVRDEYPHLLDEKNIKLKISGCMNSCGQHMVANIGLHGSSIKKGDKVIPAMQVVIGGGVDPDGKGFIAEKVIKLPTKRIPDAVRRLLDDYKTYSEEGEYFNSYFRRLGKVYFYDLLKSLGDTSTLSEEDYQDWGKEIDFIPEIGVGECAGVVLDLVGTILMDAEDRLNNARKSFVDRKWANAAYFGYNTLVIAAKAILLSEEISCNTHKGIIDDFQTHFVETGKIRLEDTFQDLVLQINDHQPTEAFAYEYLEQAQRFLKLAVNYRKGIVQEEKLVISNFYQA